MSVLITGVGLSLGKFDVSRLAGVAGITTSPHQVWLQEVGCLDAPDIFPAGSQQCASNDCLMSGSTIAFRAGCGF